MESIEYQRMYELEDHHWWFQGRLNLVSRLLDLHRPTNTQGKPRLLDIGCGTGLFLSKVSSQYQIFGLDFSREALSFSRNRGIPRLVCADSQRIPYAANSFDIVTAFDLIEHVTGDDQLVAEAWRVLRPGGIMIATVPAHPSIWSAHDVALHHKRRYVMDQFDGLFVQDHWNRVRLTWAFCTIYPVAALVRSIQKMIPKEGEPKADTGYTPNWLNSILKTWHNLEGAWALKHNLPWGLTILTVREKRASTAAAEKAA